MFEHVSSSSTNSLQVEKKYHGAKSRSTVPLTYNASNIKSHEIRISNYELAHARNLLNTAQLVSTNEIRGS
jgi:hypothetical protein